MLASPNNLSKGIAAVLVVVMVVTQIAWLPRELVAGTPAGDLKKIQYKYYFRGKYEQAVGMLQTFLARTDLEPAHVERAREFLAASHVLSGNADEGRKIFLEMLERNPRYAGPDAATFKPSVVGAWSEARDLYASRRIREAPAPAIDGAGPIDVAAESGGKPIYKKWWFYAGLVSAALVLGALSSKEEDATVPADDGSIRVGVTVQ